MSGRVQNLPDTGCSGASVSACVLGDLRRVEGLGGGLQVTDNAFLRRTTNIEGLCDTPDGEGSESVRRGWVDGRIAGVESDSCLPVPPSSPKEFIGNLGDCQQGAR